MSFSNRFKSFYEWTQKNIGIILLLPTIIGGIWQILELGSLGTPYIRFFSVSQLVSDGLLVCYILLWMGAMAAIQIYDKQLAGLIIKDRVTLGNIDEEQVLEQISECRLTSTIKFTLISIVSTALLYFMVLPKIIVVINTQILTISNLMDFTYYSIFCFIILKGLKVLFLNATNSYAFFGRHAVQNVLRTIIFVGIIAMIYVSFSFLKIFHNSFLMPSSFKNLEYVICKIKQNNPGIEKSEIQYFNDKYIFFKLIYPKNKTKIEVVSFESFLDFNNCPVDLIKTKQ